MKLFATSVLLAGANAADVSIDNFVITKSRVSRLYIDWDLNGADASQVHDYDVVVLNEDGRIFEKIRMSEPAESEREIHGLRPASKYIIQITPIADNFTGEPATFVGYTTTRELEKAYVSARTTSGAMMEWYPVDGADQYRVNDLTTNQVYFVTEPQIWVNMEAGATHNFEIQSVVCGSDCGNPPNEAWSKEYDFSATSVPPAPLNVQVSDIDVNNYDTANARITYDTPEGSWDQIKIEYSPNSPPASTESPSYSGSNGEFFVEGLYQNTIYTFTARFVSNGVEGPAFTFSQPINDFSVGQEGVGVAPRQQTCRVPTYLRAENLRVRRDPLGVNGPSMEITWDHPASKQPENGYKLVFAPFKDIVDQKPWSVNVLSTDNSYTLSGHQYDPYDEYTVSLIARHTEFDEPEAFQTDFISSHFTGTVTKHEKESMIAPDACCGSMRHNSQDGSSCCGGNLIVDQDELCCGDVAYSSSQFQCCSPGNIKPFWEEC